MPNTSEIVTKVFQWYRIASVSIWNLFFYSDPELRNWNSRDSFNAMRAVMFQGLVIGKLGNWPTNSPPVFHVVLSAIHTQVEVMIENPRPGDRNRYWNHEVKSLRKSEEVLEFIDYFDFDLMAPAEARFVKARILSSSSRPDIVGLEALIEAQYVDIVLLRQ